MTDKYRLNKKWLDFEIGTTIHEAKVNGHDVLGYLALKNPDIFKPIEETWPRDIGERFAALDDGFQMSVFATFSELEQAQKATGFLHSVLDGSLYDELLKLINVTSASTEIANILGRLKQFLPGKE